MWFEDAEKVLLPVRLVSAAGIEPAHSCASSGQAKGVWFEDAEKVLLPVRLVPGAGIEPARLAARDFESRASTNSTTRATRFQLLIMAY